ncbi:antiviral reverse transcriptase Drt3a [Erwinia tasmaniensis]|uniref:Phage-related reverse transcriptase/maturase family protein n=1 Tax=Erwinia tasmaniensis (strain DSM 17950 / CFBP 7177 / CIP 109463 / NCPPB 4357 / Et1/99) TaxID=465817 RepID=B2VC04_ERWT9|nr:antiviral reverse transcriptase Drt3a [Erwinia tasmaniensis]CAO97262.1 Putative phage-related reverse transcriptase/maturase family protein [Erwinia tasmaniensis Et1/99]
MREQSFDKFSLSKMIRQSDFYKCKNLADEQIFEKVIEESYQLAHGLTAPVISNTVSKGKDVYYVDRLSYKLILRKLQSNIRNKIETDRLQRNEIVRNLVSYLQEGVESKVICIDLKSFYESIDIDSLLSKAAKIGSLSYHSKKLIDLVLEEHRSLGGKGVPRGIELSSLLADLYLQEFDEWIKRIDGVFLYKRFVDDILIMTDHKVDGKSILTSIKNKLPANLCVNDLKTKIIKIKKRTHSPNDVKGKLAAIIDYLGYKIKVIDTHIPPAKKCASSEGKANSVYRKVVIGVSDKKLNKIKTKLCKAFYNYELNRDFTLLLDRIIFLSTNRLLINKDKNRKMPTGIFYNYPLVNDDSESLKVIDFYIRALTLGSGCRLSKKLDASLSKSQVKTLLKISFARGFTKKIHKKYSLNRLKEITRIWK